MTEKNDYTVYLKEDKKNSASIGVVILAGGNSSRMEFPKLWLPFDERSTFLEVIVESYRKAKVNTVCVVINKKFVEGIWKKNIATIESNVKIIENENPDLGRLHSLKLGLKNSEKCDFVFIHNIDSPFVETEIITKLKLNCSSEGTTIPSFQGKNGHPVLISSKVQKAIIENNSEFDTLKEILNQFDKKIIDVDSENILVNINTMDDYKLKLNELVR